MVHELRNRENCIIGKIDKIMLWNGIWERIYDVYGNSTVFYFLAFFALGLAIRG